MTFEEYAKHMKFMSDIHEAIAFNAWNAALQQHVKNSSTICDHEWEPVAAVKCELCGMIIED